MTHQIISESMELLAASTAHLSALLDGGARFEEVFGLKVAPGFNAFPGALEAALGRLETGLVEPRWWTYLFVLRAERCVAGVGGYKGAPVNGVVEIGYSIAPAYRGRGYAIEAARGLVRHALAHHDVKRVIAHTLAASSASTRVLERCGMTRAGEIHDDEAGVVWRWETCTAPN